MISFFAFSGLFNFIVSIFLAVLVYSKGRKISANKIFALDAFSVAFWSLGYFLWQISTKESTALFWSRTLMVGAIFIPIFYFHFIVAFLNLIKNYKRILYFGYILGLFFLFSNFTPYFVKSVGRELSFPFWPNPGIFFHPFLLMFFFFICLSWYLLFKSFQDTQEIIKKQQIKYLLLGTGIGFISGSTNYFLWYGIPILPYLNILVSIYVLLTTFAILKYHLFAIRVILTELLVVFIALILLIQALTAPTFWLKILGFGLLLLFGIVGYFLIRSVIREIALRTELQKAYQELKKLDETKSEFISIASHQLRTPLTAIKGYISMILEKTYGEVPEKIIKPLRNVSISNERLIKLVNDLLNISRIESGKIEMNWKKCSMGEIIASVVEELKNLAEQKNLYLKFERPQEEKVLLEISIDQDKIRQAIMNLIDNAIRYTGKGGVMIKLKTEDSPKENKFPTGQAKLKIAVSDTGEGMTKEEISNLFESFSRGTAGTRSWTEGAGLGLYVAKRFVEMHKGKIWAESPGKGKGSTFYIELPLE